MKTKSLVLLSGGLDSSVNLYQAHRDTEVIMALTFDYGQRAARKEIESARALCAGLGITHQVVELPWFKVFSRSSLTDANQPVPQGSEVSIDDLKTSEQTAEKVWVPNRNGILLNIAAGFAEGLGAEVVIPGFNAEEAATFPDNTSEFLSALDHSFQFSTATGVKTKCFTVDLSKTEIVRLGKELKVPFDQLWPCYHAGDSWCGECESCQRFQRAVKEA